jgi:hypothetical protein
MTTWRRLGRWVFIVGLGEVLGFAFPATVGVVTADSPLAFPALLAAGFVEGVVLGAAQYRAMRADLPTLRAGVWMLLTGAAAVLAYACGLLPSSSSSSWTTWPLPLQFTALAVLAVILLGSIGGAQWFELRHHLRGAGWWILGTTAGWLVGLGLFFTIAPPLWHEGQPVGQAVAVGLVAAAGMAAAMATVTGVTFDLLLKRTRAAQPVGEPLMSVTDAAP